MFNIGDKVVNAYGEENIVIDRMLSEKEQKYYYQIKTCNGNVIEDFVAEENLKAMPKENLNITVEVEILDSVVVGIIKKDGKEIARGHGHRIHEGSDGIIQAISYAFKKCWEKVNEGEVTTNQFRKFN
jgi:hypothetical protein